MSATVSVPSAGVKPKNQLFLSIFTGEKKHSIFRQAVKWLITPCWFWQGSYLASTLLRFFWLQRAEASITTPSISTPFSLTLCEHLEKHTISYRNRNALQIYGEVILHIQKNVPLANCQDQMTLQRKHWPTWSPEWFLV